MCNNCVTDWPVDEIGFIPDEAIQDEFLDNLCKIKACDYKTIALRFLRLVKLPHTVNTCVSNSVCERSGR